MALALVQARLAAEEGEIPVGAVLVRGTQILAQATTGGKQPTILPATQRSSACGKAPGDWETGVCGTVPYT